MHVPAHLIALLRGAFAHAAVAALPALLAVPVLLLTSACEDRPAPKPLEAAPLELEPALEEQPKEPKPSAGPPRFEIDETSAKVGYTRLFLDKADGPAKLSAELQAQASHVEGKAIELSISRRAKLPWVSAMLGALAERGASSFTVATETRSDYPTSVEFAPAQAAKSAPPCSPVAAITEDRATVVWKLGGGGARRRGRGLGGPDLSTTGLSIEALSKACKAADTVFVSADSSLEWGLVYDLAASTTRLEETKFTRRVLLPPSLDVGKRVAL